MLGEGNWVLSRYSYLGTARRGLMVEMTGCQGEEGETARLAIN